MHIFVVKFAYARISISPGWYNIGTVFTAAGVFLGAWLVKRTYSELTHPHPLLLKVKELDNIDNTSKTDG